MNLPGSHVEASASGSARYFTGKPCARGHVAERFTAARACIECHRELNGRWMTGDRLKNRDKYLAIESASREKAMRDLGVHGVKARSRKYNLWHNYKITTEQYDALLLEQGGVCAICEAVPSNKPGPAGRSGYLHVDHDHSTGVVRGLLCNTCNQGMVCVDRCADWPARAALYSSKYRRA